MQVLKTKHRIILLSKKLIKSIALLLVFSLSTITGYSQNSPGDLSIAHSELEGIKNCTKCHAQGNKVTNAKCLECHKEINANILARKGYHASKEVSTKECIACHTDHHGRNFKIIRLDKKSFDHKKTGFALKGTHAKQECIACHKSSFIKNPELKKKAGTYLGLNQDCLTCHADYHQGKLSKNCSNCHNFDSFKNSTGFNHSTTHFPLLGQHKKVDCVKCHKTEIINGKTVQKFTGLAYNNCTACHKDVHKNKFGQDCKKCHTEESFHFNKNMKAFNHDKTDFKLIGQHKFVDCKFCHKKNTTDPIKHDRCKDCHSDFHKKEFAKNGVSPDCVQCHNNNSWAPSTYTIEKHNSKFPLEGAHNATSCITCHKKNGVLTFSKMGKKCVDCHKNEHKGFLEEKFYPNEDCTVCHNVQSWSNVNFDHSKTNFKLDGAHSKVACSACHYGKNEAGIRTQQFAGLSHDCSSCHVDSHVGQFDINGKTDCARCHNTEDWHKTTFNHDNSRFKLVDAHKTVACVKCHKTVSDTKGKYVCYKFESITCASCHKYN